MKVLEFQAPTSDGLICAFCEQGIAENTLYVVDGQQRFCCYVCVLDQAKIKQAKNAALRTALDVAKMQLQIYVPETYREQIADEIERLEKGGTNERN